MPAKLPLAGRVLVWDVYGTAAPGERQAPPWFSFAADSLFIPRDWGTSEPASGETGRMQTSHRINEGKRTIHVRWIGIASGVAFVEEIRFQNSRARVTGKRVTILDVTRHRANSSAKRSKIRNVPFENSWTRTTVGERVYLNRVLRCTNNGIVYENEKQWVKWTYAWKEDRCRRDAIVLRYFCFFSNFSFELCSCVFEIFSLRTILRRCLCNSSFLDVC